jgi:hypothetical protein
MATKNYDRKIDGFYFVKLLCNGAANLASDHERINALNVFPVPDGDTGTNMKMTIEGGAHEAQRLPEEDIGALTKRVARAMVLSARGNSGVILSQFFKGISLGFADKTSVSVKEFAAAMKSGAKRAYGVVANPTEGTILTVMREAADGAFNALTADMTLEEYLTEFVTIAQATLKKTPDLLPILKRAGVVDSGGAGFLLVMEGMLKYTKGEEISGMGATSAPAIAHATVHFNADSVLEYGYCTEFILQLQNSKVNTETFDLNIINNFLNGIGNSIVSFKDGDLVKVHVHTFDPGVVLTEMRKYGEFITIKIENMNVQHTENSVPITAQDEVAATTTSAPAEHKKYALVAVANGDGLVKAFKEMGVDEVVAGGQTMNTSTQDFVTAFDKLNAENIFVFPNNGNIVMAARMAAESYEKAKVFVIPTRTVAEGYSAVSMLNYDSDDIEEILANEADAIQNVSTLEVTYSVRDAVINNIKIHKGDFICLLNGDLVSAHPDRLRAVKNALKAVPNLAEKQVMTILCGKDSSEEDCAEIAAYAKKQSSFLESLIVNGEQEIYSYIIGLE